MRTLIAAALLATAGTPAVACAVAPELVPWTEPAWKEQLDKEERIFIGTVLMIDNVNGAVLFAVDEPIRGVDRMWVEVRQGSTCGPYFQSAGTQWIYAGDSSRGPTREITTPLDDEELAALEIVRSLRTE